MIETNTVNCPLCGLYNIQESKNVVTRDYAFNTSNQEYLYLYCVNCEVFFLRNQPKKEFLKLIYPTNYSGWKKQNYLMARLRKLGFREKFDATNPQFNSSILDYGCGSGEFLASITSKSDCLVGYDFSIDQTLPNQSEITFTTNLATIDFEFDRIFMLQVIEHLSEPKKVLESLAKLLKTDGKILIETPCLGAWDSQIEPKSYWGGWHAPRHFVIFSEFALENLAKSCGLKVESISYLPSPYQWAENLKLRTPLFLRKLISSEKILFTILAYSLDLCQLLFTKRTSNIRVILSKSS